MLENTTFKRLVPSVLRRERGYTLVETLVVVILASIVLAAVTGTILLTRDSLDKYTATTATQESVTTATSLITREASISPEFITGDDYLMEFRNSKGEFIRYAYYDPANPAFDLSANIDGAAPQSVPDLQEPALLEMRTYDGLSYSTITVLVDNIDLTQDLRGMPLFTYYNEQNQVMTTPVSESGLNEIKRFAVRIVAVSDERESDIEVVTSVTPNESAQAGIDGSGSGSLTAPNAPVLTGSLPRPSQDATLTWNHVAGATNYVIYRDGSAAGSFTDDQDLEFIDTRPWGSTTEYFVIATGPGGSSVQSNIVPLTVVPERPEFINIDPNASGNGSTVARNLNNFLIWTPRDGAEGYRLYRGSTLIYQGTNTRYQDSGYAQYGYSTQYTVVAYNTGAYGSGGDSLTSNPVTLVSPPVAPTLNGTTSNGNRSLTWNRPSTADSSYDLNRTTPSATNWARTTTSYTDSQAVSAATFTYRVRAENAAGWGPYSNSVSLAPRPGTVSVTTEDYTDGNDGFNETCWTGGSNATYFQYRKNSGSWSETSNASTKCFTDTSPGGDSSNTYTVQACNATGCGSASSDSGLQAPGPFSISSVAQEKRNGYWANQSSFSNGLTTGNVTYKWGSASGADSYTAGGATYSTSNRSRTANITSGDNYNLSVVAVGNTSGLKRTASTYKFQSAPSMSQEITMDFQTRTDGYDTRTRIAAREIAPKSGTADRAEMATYYWNGSSWVSRRTFSTWNGASYTTDSYNKSWASSSASRGDGGWFRNYKAIDSGYNAGSVSQDNYHDSDHPVSFSTSGTYSYVLWSRLRTGKDTPWDYPSSYGSSWQDVIHTGANKPGIPSSDPNWVFGAN